MSVLRYGVCAPLAAGIALVLALMMQSIAAAEFVPQSSDRLRISDAAHVYEAITICGGYWEHDAVRFSVRPTRVPPYQNRISNPYIRNPHTDRVVNVSPRFDPSLYMPQVEFDLSLLRLRWKAGDGYYNRRISPPPIPARFLQGDHSGYCRVQFDIDDNGRPENVETTICTDQRLRKASTQAVRKWQYNTGVQPIKRKGVETTIRFNVLDEKGRLLPLPKGY